MPLLEIKDMTVSYGRIEALHGISLTVEEGELVTLIGANGAGKTTTMRAISGIRPLTKGSIIFDGQDITKMKAHLRVIAGIVQAPEGRGVFPGHDGPGKPGHGPLRPNLPQQGRVQDDSRPGLRTVPPARGTPHADGRNHVRRRAADGRHRPGADGQAAGTAARRAVDGARADDHPADLPDHLRHQQDHGVTILLVEQNAQQALSRSDRAYILETGEVVKTGPGPELLADPAIKEAYLGVA